MCTNGPYAHLRHPIYTANLVLLLGFFIATGSLWLLINCGVLFAYYRRAAMYEETALMGQFPDYSEYVSRTGRFFPAIRLAKK